VTPPRAAEDERIGVAIAALRRSPASTASELADALRAEGHVLSVRTAQRIKAAAQEQLASAGAPAAEQSVAGGAAA
jgi:hypothetical protein